MIREILETKSIIYFRSDEWETLYIDGIRQRCTQRISGSEFVDAIVNTDAELNKHNFAMIYDETGVIDELSYDCEHIMELLAGIEERTDIRLEATRYFGNYQLTEI